MIARPARGSSSDQLADVGNVSLADRSELSGQYRGHGERIACKCHELDFVGFPATVDMHYRADIARLQAISWEVGCQDNAIVLADIH